MKRDTLKNIFNAPYKSNIWKNFLKELFRNLDNNYFQTPIDLKDDSLVKHKDVEHIWEFGDISLADGKIIKFYEVVLKENQQVTKNRVGLRNILSSEIGFGYIDGAIITYHNHKALDWRFTFISKSLYWDEDNNEVKTETHPKRYTYLFGQFETVKTAVNQFEWLFNQIETRNITMEDVLKAFSVEKLSKEFYAGYFHQYETFVAYIVDNPKAFSLFTKQVYGDHDKGEKLVSDFVKKFLGRIVFLYFLQKKGWMGVPLGEEWGNGQRDFVFRLFEEFPDKNHFYQKALVPLFFYTLNQDRTENNDVFSVTNTRIPYLNGGLFEKDETEPENIQFEPQRFIELFAFFSKYNFTVDESSPDDQDIGVDPEMLGHIFENLLEDNKDKGAFYTPKEIVHYMTQESLIEYLSTHLAETEKEKLNSFVKKKQKAELSDKELRTIDALLEDVKICDPAIGSGAFPMGLLHEIFALKGLIAFERGYTAWSPARVKESIIENSIYGVDIEEGAVDIARLRFWLSLVVDEPTPRPLPNLDYKIICGNSLISRYSLDAPIDEIFREFNKGREKENKVDLEKYKSIVREYLHEANHNKKNEFKQLIEDVKAAFKTYFSNKEIKKLNLLKADLILQEGNNLFGALDKKSRIKELKQKIKNYQDSSNIYKDEEIRRLNETINSIEKLKTTAQLKKEITKLEKEKQAREESKVYQEAIEWRFEFPNLLDVNGNFEGFDIVIGNPPYGVSIKGDYRNIVVNSIGKLPDYEIYHYFTEKARLLLKEDGIFSYIIPNTYLFNTFAAQYRLNILDKWGLIEILDCTKFSIFQSATVRNTINTWRKSNLKNVGYRKTKDITSFKELSNKPRVHINVENLKLMNQNWGLAFMLDTNIIDIVSKIKLGTKQLIDYFPDVSQGLIAYDKYQGQSEDIIKNRVYHYDSFEKESLKKWLWGADVTRYEVSWNKKEYIDYCDGIANPRHPKFFDGERVLIREITNPSIFAAITSDELYNDPAIIIVKSSKEYSIKALTGILNSRLATFFHFNNSPKATKGAFPKILVKDVKEFPLPQLEINNPISTIVDYILKLKKLKQLNEFVPNSHISEIFEEVIDAMVFEVYFPEEFKKAGISFITYAERDFESIEGKQEEEQREIIHNAYQKLREKDNEIRNNLKAMKIELRDLLMPILTV
ncbi:Eco57I restriction-modification methylase domain-containing protein [Plebeiibacterium marinum]|uniref:site-specific DNA-methyltransferase (adenine-specific) n=1 Tax=Plebeiibacterium marinum TaxID=2992111 RepID=A0AAE3MDQ9_9BACT|nr:TaqI-like C-terminal specificity domain-containing protein [Plebeiobacterium marinum]MCW3805731.1 Eco57I restriction-modification methylase domain-containing protein [Plebeiobacterium marinum]